MQLPADLYVYKSDASLQLTVRQKLLFVSLSNSKNETSCVHALHGGHMAVTTRFLSS